MAITVDAAITGAEFYSRRRHKMGNTTLSTLAEWTVRIVEGWDPEKGYAIASWNGNRPERYYATDLRPLFAWSMYDKDEAEVTKGMWGAVVKVTRRKLCPKCKRRHASEQCPPKKAAP